VPHVVASRNSRGGGALALTLTLVACQADPTSTTLTPASVRRDSVSVGLAVAHRLERTAANANTCRVRETARDAAGRVVGFQGAKSERVQVTPGARDTVLAHYTIWHFDPSGKQLAEAECILRRGESASAFALGFFTTKAGRPAPLSGLGTFSALGTTPVTGTSAIGAGTTCYWIADTWNVTCGGVTCYALFNTRAAVNQRWQSAMAADTAVRVPVGASANVWAWECTNGGALSLNGNGTATYFPPGSGGGDDGGSGGPGNPCGGGGTGEPGGEGGFDNLWWGASCDSVSLAGTVCDPRISPNVDTTLACNRDRTAREDSMIAKARSEYLRVDFSGDTVAARECSYLDSLVSVGLAATLNGKQLFSTGKDDSGSPPHWGVGSSGFAHVDPRTYAAIDSAPNDPARWRRLAATLLHEAAHAWGDKEHPNGLNGDGVYTDPYFRRLNPTALDSLTCLR
jgi:hypothetical protein